MSKCTRGKFASILPNTADRTDSEDISSKKLAEFGYCFGTKWEFAGSSSRRHTSRSRQRRDTISQGFLRHPPSPSFSSDSRMAAPEVRIQGCYSRRWREEYTVYPLPSRAAQSLSLDFGIAIASSSQLHFKHGVQVCSRTPRSSEAVPQILSLHC